MERRFNLSIDAGEEGLRNLPMYNTYKIDIYKGIDNRFELSIRNNDRKSVSIKENAMVVFSLVSEDKSKKYDYEATPTKPALGLYEVIIPEFDLRSIEIGSYFGHIIVKQAGIEEPLYTTQDFYPFADVVVHENKFNTTSQAVKISGDSFTREVIQDEITGKFYEIFTSEPIKASKAPTHSILAELVEFVGDVVIEQCLREDPDPESWTELVKREYEINEDGKRFNGLDILVFSAVTEYVRVKWKREQGDEANLLCITYRPETMTGGAVASVNGKVGDVVLTGDDIKTISGEDTKTIAETVEAIDSRFKSVDIRIEGIEAVVPETATKENLLVDKTAMNDAIAPLAVKTDIDTALEEYAKTTEVSESIETALAPYAKTVEVKTDIGDALKPYATTVSVSEQIIQALEPYSTTEQVGGMVSNALTPYAKTDEVSGMLAGALAPYAKTEDVLTSITSSLEPYSTTVEMNEGISEALKPYSTTAETNEAIANALKPYAKSSEVTEEISSVLNDYSTTAEVNTTVETALKPYALSNAVDTSISTALAPYSTTEQTGEAITEALEPYALKTGVSAEIASKIYTPTITYQTVDSTRYVIREEITATGKLCTVYWHGAAVNDTAITVEVPEAFSNGIVMSVVITPETAGGAGCMASLTGTTLTATPALTADGNISLVITIYHEV